jgi:menaquinone-dependent protoporphyrinogen IX oxidase
LRELNISRALQDHLLDTKTYKRLTLAQATRQTENLKNKLKHFLEYYARKLDAADIKYLTKTTAVTDPYPKFYITAKIHKTPWKTRPIVSVPGSLLDGLGRWVDKILQPYLNATKSTILSSTTLKDKLVSLEKLPPSARKICTSTYHLQVHTLLVH